MFFPERLKSITKTDKVLEVGPGNTPFHRADVLLEKIFEDENEALLQAGGTQKKDLKKEIVYYKEDIFPFKDDEFDYVICSHVLEHIPTEQIPLFITELNRVARKGYVEVPLYNFELIANLKYHLNLLYIDNLRVVHFLSKENVDFSHELYKSFQDSMLNIGFNADIIPLNLELFGNGFEYKKEIQYKLHDNFSSFYEIIQDEMKPKKVKWAKNCNYYFKKIAYQFKSNIIKQKIYNRLKIVI